jgi:hypothetical protein
MTLCKGCSLAKIQQHSLSLINRVPHHHFFYDTALRDLHCERPKMVHDDTIINKERDESDIII